MVNLCSELGLDLNEVMRAMPFFMRGTLHEEEVLMTRFENDEQN